MFNNSQMPIRPPETRSCERIYSSTLRLNELKQSYFFDIIQETSSQLVLKEERGGALFLPKKSLSRPHDLLPLFPA